MVHLFGTMSWSCCCCVWAALFGVSKLPHTQSFVASSTFRRVVLSSWWCHVSIMVDVLIIINYKLPSSRRHNPYLTPRPLFLMLSNNADVIVRGGFNDQHHITIPRRILYFSSPPHNKQQRQQQFPTRTFSSPTKP